jgi:hypothetical protein
MPLAEVAKRARNPKEGALHREAWSRFETGGTLTEA